MEIKDKINSLKSGYGMVEVRAGVNVEHTHIYCDGIRISEDVFSWKMADKKTANEYGTIYYLTLDDISNQWYSKRRKGVLTVVVERMYEGIIYQIGRHNTTIWEKHGVTEGYE